MTTLCFAFFFFFPKPIVTKQPPPSSGVRGLGEHREPVWEWPPGGPPTRDCELGTSSRHLPSPLCREGSLGL